MKNVTWCLLVLCIASCSKKTDDVAPDLTPVANFSCTAPALVNTAIKFENTSVNAATYNWDFGDSTTSQEESPVHVYKKAGTYSVVLITFGKPEAYIVNDAIVKQVKIAPPSH